MQKYTYIIFDLVGVIFTLNKYQLFRTIGIVHILWYMITHFKNPLITCFSLLRIMYDEQKQSERPLIFYKNIPLPDCISAFMLGDMSHEEVLQKIHTFLDRKDMEGYFSSAYEKHIITELIDTLFDSTKTTQFIYPVNTTIDIIKKLKQHGFQIILLSNLDTTSYQLLNHLFPKVFALFNDHIISAQVKLLKPYKEIFFYVLKKYAISAQECLFIDDQKENVIAARSIGIDSILFRSADQLIQELRKRQIL